VLQGWDPECDRRAKEILYRCLEELGATKAALYLAGGEDSFELVSAYGFGKREAIAAVVRPGDPLYYWVRRHRTGPECLNDVHDDPPIGRMLEAASTARLLTIPLTVGDRLVGFVDARDKAKRLAYTTEDLTLARSIGAAFTLLIADLGLYPSAEDPTAAADPVLAVTQLPPAAAAPPGLHHAAIEDTAALLRSLARLPGVAVIAITVSDGTTVRVEVMRSLPLEQPERQAIATHQLRAFEGLGVRVPPLARWGWSEADSGGEERRREEIRTAVLHGGPQVWVVGSVLTPSGSPAGDIVLAAAAGCLAQSVALRDYRRAARNAARVLLEPGEQSFPHLRQHSQNVSELAQRMVALLRLSEAEEELVTLAAYLHDVGMRELDYSRVYRLERPGEMERRVYQRHPVIGARIVESITFPGDLAGAIRHHHERWDGTGYPHRLAGGTIPLSSRVIHLAEVYDVLTSTSSYRRPIGRKAALDTIRAESGRQFDPDLVGVLEEAAGP
jgi:putative nucleotidyltransferase with HDIG domain